MVGAGFGRTGGRARTRFARTGAAATVGIVQVCHDKTYGEVSVFGSGLVGKQSYILRLVCRPAGLGSDRACRGLVGSHHFPKHSGVLVPDPYPASRPSRRGPETRMQKSKHHACMHAHAFVD